MTEADLPGLSRQVLLASFGLAALFGAVAQRSHFCTMGAVSDLVAMGDSTRMRMWVVAMAVAMMGFNTMVALGWLKASDSIYAAPKLLWLSNMVGGALFGFGMVLASGCGSKTLVRIGGGSLKSLVVFFVLAFAAYATMRGIVAVGRVASIDRVLIELPAGQDLPSLLAHASGIATPTAAGVLGIGLAVAMLLWVLSRPEGRRAEVWWAGLAVGFTVVAVWWVSGRLGHLAEHPVTLEEVFIATNSQRMESLTFVAPVAYTVDWLILFSDKSKLLTIGIVTVLGVIAGSAVVALATRSFRWEGFAGAEDTALHLVGAALMGVGGVTAMGCTVGQGLTGLSTLAVGSVLTLMGILGGAVVAIKWQMWRLERLA
ncbi:MAG: YeeE/YedE family protein [Rubrivivax sp.]|nr:YeeE/YedE family protein [Rubrivivax sp.]